MSSSLVPALDTEPSFSIVFDDACPVVHRLGWIVRQWDRRNTFLFVGRDSTNSDHADLIRKLDETPWSLMLIDRDGNEWLGPDAIPFILKNLPSGKIAAVTYTIPGTMWLTRKLYYMVSRNRNMFTRPAPTASTALRDRAAS
jgi:predicted DCC family thiol-disulfide oxidoreductase YuxK